MSSKLLDLALHDVPANWSVILNYKDSDVGYTLNNILRDIYLKQVSTVVVNNNVDSVSGVNNNVDSVGGVNNNVDSVGGVNNTVSDVKKYSINKSVTPSIGKVFEFARLTPLSNIKVVILGQDPYPKANDAHGLAFSCTSGIPASLRNIYKCLLHNGLIDSIPQTGLLTEWARQGVLLLNTSLTTVIGSSNVHAKQWETYVMHIIQSIAKLRPIIFMLWGNSAKKYEECILLANEASIIYTWSHPSPLAQTKQSFITCPHFADANKLLPKLGHAAISWSPEPEQDEINKLFNMTNKTQVIFTDGSCYPNNGSVNARAGYAAEFALGTMKDVILYGNIECGNGIPPATNNRAEGIAIWKSMIYLSERLDKWDTVVIVSDSEFWINMFEKYMPAWAQSNKFDEKKNADITKQMYDLYMTLIYTHKKNIQFRHMRSHGKDGWNRFAEGSYEHFCYTNNDYVDQLATYARTTLKVGKHKIGTV